MDDHINVGHPFYFPTQVVMVDDDPDFLDGISLMFDKNLSYRLFHSASEALDYVNKSHQQVSLLERCYSNYKTGPQESDSLSHVDIGKLHIEIFNSARFQTSATVVVDYSMPEMNGLEFLMELKNPFIKKILLAGQADTELAIKAFNKQLIDQYIDKHDPRLKQILNSTISVFSDQYFRSSFKLITDPIIANNHDAFLADARFQKYFSAIRLKTDCVEYYMIDHAQHLKEMNASEELIWEVSRGESIPGFDVTDESLNGDHSFIKNWEHNYHPAIKINSVKNYFVTFLSDENLPDIYKGNIIPYSDFIENNSLNRQILH